MIGSCLRRAISESDGNVAIILALICLPILVMTGFALDSARQVNTSRHLQYATDMASMAAARAMEDASLTDEELAKIAKDYYIAQLQSSYGDVTCADPTVTVDREDREVTVAGGCNLPTIFGAYVSGRDKIGVTQTGIAEVDLTGLELAIALDISVSMTGTPLEKAKEAANHLIGEVLNERTEDRVRVALVPFTATVNAGIYGNRAMGRADTDDRFGDGESIVCVRERNGVERLTDAAPGPGARIKENTASTPDYRCPSVAVMPLSNDADTVVSTVDSLNTSEVGTGGHFAMSWAWYTLSPKWDAVWPSDAEPTAYDTNGVVKAVVLLSDGAFQHVFLPNGIPSFLRAHNDTMDLCAGMKGEGIEIYVVGINPDPGTSYLSAERMLQTCASGEDYYFHADDENDFYDIFDKIASHLRSTHLIG